jgi:predicted O-linked N-acetylglucosamine transferase (SPINDLY family)
VPAAAGLEARLPPLKDGPRERLTIGYLSSDFRDHAMSYVIPGILEAHDRRSVAVHAYSLAAETDHFSQQRIRAGVDRYVTLHGIDDASAAQRIRADGVDILIDLMGHTTGQRWSILALRPSPVTVTYLGHPGTTGAGFVDYVIADRVVAPPHHQRFFSERLVYVSPCYFPADDRQQIADDAVTRAECGLPEAGIVFCSFNQAFKFEPTLFGAWMRMLRALPDSVLWLLDDDPAVQRNLRHAAANRGIAGDRLVFAPRRQRAHHLNRLRLADIALDTRHYNGHTTTVDALSAGVPVVTLLGHHWAARVAASILAAAGLPELVAERLREYEALALRLASDSVARAALRERIRRAVPSSPLFDTAGLARQLEAAYRAMWDRHAAGRPPARIDVPGR